MSEPPDDPSSPPPAPSATVVLLRRAVPFEVLLVRRSGAMRFYGGAWVFPGGRVDAEEATVATDPVVVARLAATRELEEETALRVDPDALRPLSRWTTPVQRPRRYRAWFFLSEHPGGEVRVDGEEILEHRWAAPEAMLVARQEGALILPPPVFVTLQELARAGSFEAALALPRAGPIHYDPRVAAVEGGHVSLYAGDAGFDAIDGTLEGPRHRLWMVGARWRYEREG